MTTDSRKIQLETAVDATGAKAGFQQVKDSAKDMASSVAQAGQQAAKGLDGVGAGAEVSAQKVDRATSNLIGSIQRATAAQEAGKKSGAEFFESLAKQRGIPSDAIKPYIDQLREVESRSRAAAAATVDLSKLTTSLGASSFQRPLGSPTTSLGATGFGSVAVEAKAAEAAAIQSLGKIGVSAGQTAFALRQVPAQFTDIVTSLQGGQQPLTVFLQQGGQLKDMFGGIGPAARALGGYVLGLINPFTVAAAAVGTLGLAFFQGAKESAEYNKALILTGNYLGLTVTQLQGYAKAVSQTVGTQGAAAEALTALAKSGKVASGSLTEVGTAVVLMNRVLGESVDKATETFVKLAEEPTKASVKLNESMHYLSLATYERIRALEEQGKKEEAAALAQKTLADETTLRLQKVEQSAGTLEKAWRTLTDGAKAAWDAMLGIGRQQSVGDALANAQKKLAESQAQAGKGGMFASLYAPAIAKQQQDVADLSRKALREQDNAFAEGEKARDNAAKIGASDRLKTLSDEVRTNADKRKKALADLDRDFKTLGKPLNGAEYDKLVANINDKFKDPKEPKGKAFQDDAATKMLENLRQQEASLKEQLNTDVKLTEAEKERAKFVQLVADLKTKGTLTADQKSLVASQDAIKAQLDKNVAVSQEVELQKKVDEILKKSAEDAKAYAQFIEGVNISIESSARSRAEQFDRELSAFGLGDRVRQEIEAQKSIRREFDALERSSTKNAAKNGQLGSEDYKNEVAHIKKSLDEALKAQQDYFDALKAKREDWVNGATTALANYIDEINDASKRAQELVTGTLNGITDSITGLIMGDKGSSFKDVGKRIAEQITRGIVEQQLTKPIAEWLQGSLKDSDSMIGKLIGGLTSNKETGESWLGFLGLGSSKKDGGAAARGNSAANPLYVQAVGGFGGSASGGGSISDWATGAVGKLFGGLSNGFATTAANALPGDALDNLIKLQGGWGTMLGFANGGDPPVGRVSMVGERGPELFVPRQAGTIVPNHALGGGGDTYISIPVDGRVDRETKNQIANAASMAQRQAARLK